MITTSARIFALLSCLLSIGVTAIPTRASDQPSKKPARFDATGDSIPEGTVARLGTLRLVHRGQVAAVAVSSDGKLLASGVYSTRMVTRLAIDLDKGDAPGDKRAKASPRGIRLWDTRTGKLIRELQTPEGHTSCLLFSADGADLYGACGFHLCCWNPHTGEKRWEKSTLDEGKLQMQLHESKLVLAGDRLVSIHAGHLNCEIRGDNWSMSTSHSQMAVRIWNRKTGAIEPLAAALESTNTTGKDIPVLFHNLAVSADGRVAAVIASYAHPPRWFGKGKADKAAIESKEDGWRYPNPRFQIVNLGTGAVRHDFLAANIANTHMTFSSDGSLLAIAAGKELWLLDVATGRKSRLASGVPEIQELLFVPSTQRIAVQFADQSIRVWDYTTGGAIDAHAVRDYHFHARQSSPIVAIGQGNAIRLLDRATGKPLLDFGGHREAPSLRFGPVPENTLSSLDSEQLYRWEAGTWKVQQHIRIQPPTDRGWRYGNWHYLGGESVSADAGLRLMDNEQALTLHDLRTGKLVRTLDASAGKQRTAFFSPNGARVISMEKDRIVSFDVATGKRLAAIDHPSEHRRMRFSLVPSCSPVVSPMGTFFAESDQCTDVDILSIDSGKQLRKLSGARGAGPDHRFAILQLWFSPDERFILAEIHRQLADESGGESVEIAVWVTGSGALVQEVMIVPRMQVFHRSSLQIHSIGALAMSSDRRLIALARNDHSDIEIWDTASATRRGVLSGHEGVVTDLAFSQDGRYLASSSDDTTVLVWDLNRQLHAAASDDKLTKAKLAASWRTLGEPDAAHADAAIWHLVNAKAASVALLKIHLRPRLRPDPMQVKRLLDELDSDDFNTRSRAQADLASCRELVLGELKAALTQKGSLERQRRIQLLLAQAERAALPFGTPDLVREWRALEVLERTGSPEAVELLQALAAGAPSSPLTVHAAEVLARLRPARK